MKHTIFFFIFSPLLWLPTRPNPGDAVLEKLASTDWMELVEISLELTEKIGVDNTPPAVAGTKIGPDTTLELNYDRLMFSGPEEESVPIPDLGRIVSLKTYAPFPELENLSAFGFQEIFEVTKFRTPRYLAVCTDGPQSKILYLSEKAALLSSLTLEEMPLAVSFRDHHLALLTTTSFQVYEMSEADLIHAATFPTKPIANFLQKQSNYAERSEAFHCADFQFEFHDGNLDIWAFNVSTTAFLPDFLHLRFRYAKHGNTHGSTFGQPTRADCLPVPSLAFISARIADHFWVPRSHDSQIDIFNLAGKLIKTVVLAPTGEAIRTGHTLSSGAVLAMAKTEPDQASFYRSYQTLNFIDAIFPFGDFALVRRKTSDSPGQYPVIYTLLNQNGGILAEDFTAHNFGILGSGPQQIFTATMLKPMFKNPPPWLVGPEMKNLAQIREHQGPWLLGFELASNGSMAEQKTSSKGSRENQHTPAPSIPTISTKLKKHLLKARQLRNLIVLDGFLKLKVPPEHGIKKVTDAVFVKDHYFILDEPGRQILKFDREGNFLQTVSRRGQGPGEFNRPRILTRVFDDNFIVSDRKGALLFDHTGKFLRRLTGLREKGMHAMAYNPIIWETPERLYLADPFPDENRHEQFGLITLDQGKIVEAKGFGKRQHFVFKDTGIPMNYLWTAFAKVGDRIWAESPYRAVIQVFDSEGRFIEELKASQHPNGIDHDDVQSVGSSKEFEKYSYKNRILRTWSLHPLGPIVIRTLLPSVGKPIYDIFDTEGRLLAKSLGSGASYLELLDTYDSHLVGKLPIFDFIELNEEGLAKSVYRHEYDALFKSGFQLGDDDEAHYLWLGHLSN